VWFCETSHFSPFLCALQVRQSPLTCPTSSVRKRIQSENLPQTWGTLTQILTHTSTSTKRRREFCARFSPSFWRTSSGLCDFDFDLYLYLLSYLCWGTGDGNLGPTKWELGTWRCSASAAKAAVLRLRFLGACSRRSLCIRLHFCEMQSLGGGEKFAHQRGWRKNALPKKNWAGEQGYTSVRMQCQLLLSSFFRRLLRKYRFYPLLRLAGAALPHIFS